MYLWEALMRIMRWWSQGTRTRVKSPLELVHLFKEQALETGEDARHMIQCKVRLIRRGEAWGWPVEGGRGRVTDDE